jgi:hypothetical protein
MGEAMDSRQRGNDGSGGWGLVGFLVLTILGASRTVEDNSSTLAEFCFRRVERLFSVARLERRGVLRRLSRLRLLDSRGPGCHGG